MSQTSPLGLAERKRSEDRPAVLHVVPCDSAEPGRRDFRVGLIVCNDTASTRASPDFRSAGRGSISRLTATTRRSRSVAGRPPEERPSLVRWTTRNGLGGGAGDPTARSGRARRSRARCASNYCVIALRSGRPSALRRSAVLRTRACPFPSLRLKQAPQAPRRAGVPGRCASQSPSRALTSSASCREWQRIRWNLTSTGQPAIVRCL
jgi:hypothetical protein